MIKMAVLFCCTNLESFNRDVQINAIAVLIKKIVISIHVTVYPRIPE